MHHLSGTQHETSVCHVLQRPLVPKKTLLDNFKRAILEAKHLNEFRPDDVLWEKISKGLLRNPDRFLKNTYKRMVYIYNNMFFVKKDFAFGFRTVKSGEMHLIQLTHVPMLIYELPSSSLGCRANPNLFRRSFEPYDQMLYHRMVLEPHTAYPIPAGTRYILLTVQKTVFGLDIIFEMILPQLMENGFNLGDFRQRKRFDQKAYKLPPPTPAQAPFETNKRPLEQQPKHFSKNKRVVIAPIIRPSVAPVRIIKPSTALATPQPVSIPEPPERTTAQILLSDPPTERTTPQILLPDPPPKRTKPQILLPDPPVPTTPQILLPDPPKQTTPQIILPDPPVVETLEPTFMDDYSVDQILSSEIGNYLKQGIPLAHILEPQVLDSLPSLFDESNDLISFLDNFETGLALEQETPMDLTMPRMKKKVINTIGFKVIEPLDLSIRNCLPCILETRAGQKWFRYNTCWTSVDRAPLSCLKIWVGGRIESRITSQTILTSSFLNPILGCTFLGRLEKTVIVFTSHLDLTWDKWVELRFFEVVRPHSHRDWEAYQPHMTDAYSLDLTDCPRVADVYVKWLTWLDDWEMHRDDPVPWRIVGLQPWKRALEQHVQRLHEKALAHGMPSDVTLLDHI
ncbi:uncharacterized protein TNCV_4761111 [Trichonephila clavipes]|uniref:Uncharacterized protein n=1 Tax=Trichonephila clavipes TaxID=2585209 RepID=A0A8X6RIL0_TRICX|nr:uncharacterized protein TNCV_4761111 [Trichonephila clavipes]